MSNQSGMYYTKCLEAFIEFDLVDGFLGLHIFSLLAHYDIRREEAVWRFCKRGMQSNRKHREEISCTEMFAKHTTRLYFFLTTKANKQNGRD